MSRRDDPTFLNFPRVVQAKTDVPWVGERESRDTLILADMEGIAAQDAEALRSSPAPSPLEVFEAGVADYGDGWGEEDAELQGSLDALLGLAEEAPKERRSAWSGTPTTDGFRRGLRAELGDDSGVALLMARAAGCESAVVAQSPAPRVKVASPRTKSDPAQHRISTSELEVLFAPDPDGYSEPLGGFADALARQAQRAGTKLDASELHARLECMFEVASAVRGRTQSGPTTALVLPQGHAAPRPTLGQVERPPQRRAQAQGQRAAPTRSRAEEAPSVEEGPRGGYAPTQLSVGRVSAGPPLDLLGALGMQGLAVFPMMEAQGGWPLGPTVALAPLLGGVGLWLGGRGLLGQRASRACLWMSAALLLAFLVLPMLSDALGTFRAFGHGLPHLLGLLPLWVAVVPALHARRAGASG